MKRSPSSSSSSSSSVGFEPPKRRRPKHQTRKCNQNKSTGIRSSIYRGVTRHRLTGRFEAHLWDKSSWNSEQTKKGRQVYLGAYDIEEVAARTYDLAALKYWGKDAILNFPIETYTKDLEEMDKVSREEYLASLRRQSSGFSRGVSKYRGVARHHHNGRWEARIGRVSGSKYLYLGTFETQEEAAAAYDKAALAYRGLNAVTNFDKSKYDKDEIIKMKIDQQSQETETVPNSSDSEEAEVVQATTPPLPENQETQQPQQHQAKGVQCSNVPPPIEESSPPVTAVVDSVLDDDLPWSSFMDGDLSQFQSADLTSSKADKDLLSMFDGSDFEVDIDFLLSTEPSESDFNLSAVLDSIGDVEHGAAAGSKVDDDEKQKQLSSSSAPSSQSSPTTTVSSDFSF